MVSAQNIVLLHQRCNCQWHAPSDNGADTARPANESLAEWGERAAAFMVAVQQQHQANFELWHIEDEARRPGASDSEIANVKRRIDITNQRRNDLAEDMDRILMESLLARGLPDPDATLNSESPGLIIDRLSILSLKIYHTREEGLRTDAPPGHAERNRDRLAILEEQLSDLAACLDLLWRQTLLRQRRFRIYRQLKMYNDPALNPAIYRREPDKVAL